MDGVRSERGGVGGRQIPVDLRIIYNGAQTPGITVTMSVTDPPNPAPYVAGGSGTSLPLACLALSHPDDNIGPLAKLTGAEVTDNGNGTYTVTSGANGAIETVLQFNDDTVAGDNYQVVATATFPDGSSTRANISSQLGTVSVSQLFRYDTATGAPIRRDTTASTTSAFNGKSFKLTQTYNTLGLVDTITYPCQITTDACTDTSSSKGVHYSYGEALVSAIDDGSMTPSYWASAITYQPNGLIDTVTHGNTTREIWTPDSHAMARPAKISVQNASNTELWTTGTYTYDGAGNIKTEGTTTYTYDALQQLRTARDGSESSFSSTAFTYDPFGNYVASTKTFCNGAICGSTSALNRKVSTSTNHSTDDVYDDTGNVTTNGARTFTYDPLGMMKTAAVTGRTFINLYTADGERVAIVEPKTFGSAVRNRTTWTLRGFDNQLLRSYVDDSWSGTRTITLREDEIWRGSHLLASTGSTVRHYALDHLGSPRLITSSTGTVVQRQTFAPFGAGGTIDGGMLQFTGHERDAANVADTTNTPPTASTADLPDYLHARAYDAYQGRFLSVDPVVDMKTNLRNPQGWNRYAYVRNNPLKNIDADGHLTIIVAGTWAKDEDWPKKGAFNEAVSRRFGEKAIAFSWSGANNKDARALAARGLKAFIDKNRQPGEPLNIVAHSHGGNVVKAYTQLEGSQKIDTFIALGTPQRSDYKINGSKVDNYINVFSNGDQVQRKGGEWGVALAGRTDPAARNIDVTDANASPAGVGHAELHTEEVLEQVPPR